MALSVIILDIEPALPSLTSQHLMPRHGVLSVATTARDAGHDVGVYVEVLNGMPSSQIVQACQVVGAAVTTTNLSRVREFFAAAAACNPAATFIVGGPHATVCPTDVLSFADIAVRDEGEATFTEVLSAVETSKDLTGIPGISFSRDGRCVHNARRQYALHPEIVEDPGLLVGFKPKSAFRQLLDHGGRYCGYAVSSRGCPFPCTFCYENMIGGTGHRTHGIGSFIEDIRRKRDYFGIEHFWLADSNFGTNPRHCREVLRALIDARLGCSFTALCRVEIASRPDILELMYEAGFATISLGMEAIDDRTLVDINKRQTVDRIKQAIVRIHDAGMSVFGLFMVGFDGDTAQTPHDITAFCRRNGVDGLSMYCLSEYPSLPGRTLPRYRICELRPEYYSGHFVTTFPKRVRPSVLETAVFDALTGFYSVGEIVRTLAASHHRGLEFKAGLYLQMRKMERVSKSHRRHLARVEAPYYDRSGHLLEAALAANPVIKEPLASDVLADWIDPVVGMRHSAQSPHEMAG